MEVVAIHSRRVFSPYSHVQNPLHSSYLQQGRIQSLSRESRRTKLGARICCKPRFAIVETASFRLIKACCQQEGRKLPGAVSCKKTKKKDASWNCVKQTDHDAPEGVDVQVESLISKVSKFALCALSAGALLLHSGPSAWAKEVTVTFPGSRISEVVKVQRTLVEAWGIVRETYVDTSFNNQDWDLVLQTTLTDTLSMTSSEIAYSKVRTMLASLGDPFTRIITPKEYESFRINNDGALEGVGLLIAAERDTGRLIVMSPIEGGPAARAGIIPGDELVQIDDQMLTGLNGDEVATRLRGRAGTSVTLVLRRSITNEDTSNEESMQFKLQRETIFLSPVYSTVLAHSSPDGRSAKTGYIRLAAFSQNAAAEMEKAISSLEVEGVESYILDLRNNPGGLVKVGLDVARMWLDGSEILVNTIDREGYAQPVTLVNGRSLTRDPLVVLVNEGSASASEILAGALHDNGRAVLVGQQTYGKGKIQSVTELTDGSALFVTVAKYLSPKLHEIDHKGIAPDLKCSIEESPSYSVQPPGPPPEKFEFDSKLSVEERIISRLQQDSCVMVAEHELDKSISS